MKKPKISIITVSYNSDKTIKETIKSVNSQSFVELEHIFIDGKSTDRTVNIIEEYSKRDKVIISQSDNGIYDALNHGVKLARGEIIGILHSDDKFSDLNILKHIYNTFIKYKCDLVWGNVKIFEKDSEELHRLYSARFNALKMFNIGIMPPHPSVFIKADLYKKHGNFNISYKIASDYDLILRLFLAKEIKAKFIDKTIVSMKTGGNLLKI